MDDDNKVTGTPIQLFDSLRLVDFGDDSKSNNNDNKW